MRVGLISGNGQARNAVGNHLAEKLAFFLDRGADARVFLHTTCNLHPKLAGHSQLVDEATSTGPAWDFLKEADLIIVDFAHAHKLLDFLPLLAGGKPRLLLEYHGISPPHLWPGPQRALLEQGLALRGLAWCVDYALVHSQFTRGELARATGFPEDRIIKMDFPLDERFSAGISRKALRRQLGLESAHVLLFVGRLAVNKGVPVLIEAVAILRNQQREVHAVILGDASDIYREVEKDCREQARQLGIEDRIHFVGSVPDDELADCYRDADALVLPSVHEGFGIPVLEAMACGLPVIAARAAALPETVGQPGLTFVTGDAKDLADQVRRVLHGQPLPSQTGSVAIVCFRYGSEIVGGAETSLRKIALTLARQGRRVEVFTTCTRAESDWRNELPAGTVWQDGVAVHRFPIDPHDCDRHHESYRRIIEAAGSVSREEEQAYLEHSIHSRELLAALEVRIDAFDAVITGPYLFGLTWDIARAFPEKTLLLPCFHQEPLARLQTWPAVYGRVGGILYHSPEERELAQTELGVNHPNSTEIGTWLHFSFANGQWPMASGKYLVFCGRYSRQKELPRLLEFAARYHAERPGRFELVFMGRGEVAIPKATWARDLGRVDKATKQSVLAGAAALVQLSRQESLSLVVLEAWAQGTPVIVDKGCPVLAGQIRRSGGGQAILDFADFCKCLDDLWSNPTSWQEYGRQGQSYVRQNYTSAEDFGARISTAIDGLCIPLREHMRVRGLERAALSTRSQWRERFGLMVEQLLDREPRVHREEVRVTPLRQQTRVKTGTQTVLIPARVENRGTHALGATGQALFCQVKETGQVRTTPLPGLLLPGKTQTMTAVAEIPGEPGQYHVSLWIDREAKTSGEPGALATGVSPLMENALITAGEHGAAGCAAPFLDSARESLVEIDERRHLPADYVDVTEGWAAGLKRWIKKKLLGNFKRGYVDVMSRQQSLVNQQILAALQQLTEGCAALDHAVLGMQKRMDLLEERLDRITPINCKSKTAARHPDTA